MIKKLFLNRWVTFGMMALVAIADLLTLPGTKGWSAGWALLMIWFIASAFLWINQTDAESKVKKPVTKSPK